MKIRSLGWAVVVAGFSFCAGCRKQTTGVAYGSHSFWHEDKTMGAAADFEFSMDGDRTSEFKLIGPVAIFRVPDGDYDWDEPFTQRKTGGEWRTKKGVLKPGGIYFVKGDGTPVKLADVTPENSQATLDGKWPYHAGAALILSRVVEGGKDSGDPGLLEKLKGVVDGK